MTRLADNPYLCTCSNSQRGDNQSRGRLVNLQILTSSLFSLVDQEDGSLGQRASFSSIDGGSGFTASVFFLMSVATVFWTQGSIMLTMIAQEQSWNVINNFAETASHLFDNPYIFLCY